MNRTLKIILGTAGLVLLSGCSFESSESGDEEFVYIEDTLDDGTYVPPVSKEALYEEAMRNRPEIREGIGADATAGGRPKGSGGFLANTANLPSIESLGLPSELPVSLPLGVQDPIQHYISEQEKHSGEGRAKADSRTLMEKITNTARKENSSDKPDATKVKAGKEELCEASKATKVIKPKSIEVISGDTVKVKMDSGDSKVVKLLGIDAPKDGQQFAVSSKTNLQACLSQQKAYVYYEKTDSKDQILGKLIITTNNKDCNLEQIKSGYAWHNKSQESMQYEVDRFKYSNAEVGARMSDFGLWSADEIVAPWDFGEGTKKSYRFNNRLFDASSASCTKDGLHTS